MNPRSQTGQRSGISVICAGPPRSTKSQNTPPLSRTKLPNGWPIAYVSKPDVPFLYHEIFNENCYIQHGVELRDDSIVLDVGANIGMFGMYLADKYPKSTVVCVEPVPTTFAALQENLAWIKSAGRSTADIRALNCGVSDGTNQQAEFTFYRGAAGWSTMYPDDKEVQDAVLSYVSDALPAGRGLEDNPLTWFGQWLSKRNSPLGNEIIKKTTSATVKRILGQQQQIQCELCTVSQVLLQQSLPHIDLLKVDVERAELEVLEGIVVEDWPKIKQVVLEVHNINGRLAEVVALLRQQHFSEVTTDQPGSMEGSEMWNVYACR